VRLLSPGKKWQGGEKPGLKLMEDTGAKKRSRRVSTVKERHNSSGTVNFRRGVEKIEGKQTFEIGGDGLKVGSQAAHIGEEKGLKRG